GRAVARQLGLQRVTTGREVEESEIALRIGNLRLRGTDAGESDGHAWQDASVFRLNLAVDITGLELRVPADGEQHEAQRGGNDRQEPEGGAPFHSGSFH